MSRLVIRVALQRNFCFLCLGNKFFLFMITEFNIKTQLSDANFMIEVAHMLSPPRLRTGMFFLEIKNRTPR
jgi:hypothetical protein